MIKFLHTLFSNERIVWIIQILTCRSAAAESCPLDLRVRYYVVVLGKMLVNKTSYTHNHSYYFSLGNFIKLTMIRFISRISPYRYLFIL